MAPSCQASSCAGTRRLNLDALDATRGTLFLQRGAPDLAGTTRTGALFVEATPLLTTRVLLRAGARADWQAGEGVLLSPRTTLLTGGRGFGIVSRAGLFVEPLSPAFFLEASRRDALGLQTAVLPNVAAFAAPAFAFQTGEPLALRLAPGLARRRDLVVQTMLARRIGPIAAGLDHKWTRGMALAGATRARTPSGLLDVVDANRRLSRHQIHARAGWSRGAYSMTAHYEFVHSLDNADDPFSLPARPDDVAGEWGSSTGVVAHHASVVASLTLPGAIRAFVSGNASSGSPYSVVTGRDPQGLAAFVDRGGAPRNAALGPLQRSVSIYASRRMEVPRARGLAVDVGVRMENIFDRTNVTAVGAVAGTAWVGHPLTALAGRTLNVWISVAR